MSARTAADILGEFNIHPPSFAPGRYLYDLPSMLRLAVAGAPALQGARHYHR